MEVRRTGIHATTEIHAVRKPEHLIAILKTRKAIMQIKLIWSPPLSSNSRGWLSRDDTFQWPKGTGSHRGFCGYCAPDGRRLYVPRGWECWRWKKKDTYLAKAGNTCRISSGGREKEIWSRVCSDFCRHPLVQLEALRPGSGKH